MHRFSADIKNTSLVLPESEISHVSMDQKLKDRSARFGISNLSQNDLKKSRAKRFNLSSSDSIIYDKADEEQKKNERLKRFKDANSFLV